MGVVLLTVILKLFGPVPLETGWKVEKKPPALGVHGAAKVDCTTEWSAGWKKNSTSWPTAAVISFGVNFRPFSPTWT